MSQTVTLTLPDKLYSPVRRMAEATHQPIEEVLLTALQATLPPLDGLPPDLANALTPLEALNNEALWAVMLETVPVEQQRALDDLLRRNQAEGLSEAERDQLTALQRAADLVMLRKARAAVLLRFRGQRLPTLSELRQLTFRKLWSHAAYG